MKEKESLPKTFYTVDQFVARIDGGVTKNAVYNLIRQGKIPVQQLGNRILIPAIWVNDFCNSCMYKAL